MNDLSSITNQLNNIINSITNYYKNNHQDFEINMAYQKLIEAKAWIVDYKNKIECVI